MPGIGIDGRASHILKTRLPRNGKDFTIYPPRRESVFCIVHLNRGQPAISFVAPCF